MRSKSPGQVYPEPIVGALFLDTTGMLLLVRCHKWEGRFGLPDGHIKIGERLEAAVIRDAVEEPGLTVRDPRFLCFQELVFDEQCWERSHFIFFEFNCVTPNLFFTRI